METISLLTLIAKTVGVSPALLLAICTQETNLKNVHNYTDGGSPSYGVCQVKLDTAQFVGKVMKRKDLVKFTAEDLKIPKQNIKVAALYLKYQLNRYGHDWCKATAAYNAGSYRESAKLIGKPKNWKYVRGVIEKIGDEPEILELFNCRHGQVITAQELVK